MVLNVVKDVRTYDFHGFAFLLEAIQTRGKIT